MKIWIIAAAMLSATSTVAADSLVYQGGYKSQPPVESTPLLKLKVLNKFEPSNDFNTDKPIVSAAWTRNWYIAPSGGRKDARIVYASFGASEDLLSDDARQFFINACLWAGNLENGIKTDLDASIVGGFDPSPYTTGAFYYDNVQPSELAGFDSRVMPAAAKLGGLTDPKMLKKVAKAFEVRHELKAALEKTHPGIGNRQPRPAANAR